MHYARPIAALALLTATLLLLSGCGTLPGGQSPFRDIRTMNFPLSDAAPMDGEFIEARSTYLSFENESILDLGLQAECAFWDRFAVGGRVGYLSTMPDDDRIEGRSGATDPMLTGWGALYNTERTALALGGRTTIPVGEDDINQGNFDFGGFVAGRSLFAEDFLGVANVGVDSYEPFFDDQDREFVLSANASLLYQLQAGTRLFGSLRFQQDPDFASRLTRFDYGKIGASINLSDSFDLRAAGGLGFGDFAPDYFAEFGVGIMF